jgi:hypothetical protein
MDVSATTAISKLRRLALKELQTEYERVFGKPSKSRNREWLFKVIAKKLQDNEEPESANGPVPLPTLIAKYEKKGRSAKANKSKNKTKAAAREKKAKTRVKPVGSRDERLPKVGTTIERVYKGKKLLVTVEAEGFTFGGKSYRSLSALAAHITGSKAINGFLFFQLGDYTKPAKDKASK